MERISRDDKGNNSQFVFQLDLFRHLILSDVKPNHYVSSTPNCYTPYGVY